MKGNTDITIFMPTSKYSLAETDSCVFLLLIIHLALSNGASKCKAFVHQAWFVWSIVGSDVSAILQSLWMYAVHLFYMWVTAHICLRRFTKRFDIACWHHCKPEFVSRVTNTWSWLISKKCFMLKRLCITTKWKCQNIWLLILKCVASDWSK